MDGDVASDGPYSIEDVPWIMYFNGGFALHGAFWHSSFGHERSHGCVNLDALRREESLRLGRPAAARGLARRPRDGRESRARASSCTSKLEPCATSPSRYC